MLSLLLNPLSWKTICIDDVVNDVCRSAQNTFPDHFTDQTNAKIYFFVVVNKNLLFEDSFSMQISGTRENGTEQDNHIFYVLHKMLETELDKNLDIAPVERFIRFEKIIHAKQIEWQKKIQQLAIPLFSELTLVMQAVMRNPRDTTIEFEAPLAYANQCIGWFRDRTTRGLWARHGGQISPEQIG
jgi:hypothetical protein